MSSSLTVHEGGMRCCTSWENNGQTCCTDVGTAMGGMGEFPSPAALMTAAVASCMLSMIALTGQNKGENTTGIRIASDYETDEKGRISALLFDITVPSVVSPTVRRMMESAVKICPVGAIIDSSVEKRITWNWTTE